MAPRRRPFTLTGPGITSVIFDRTTLNTSAGLNRVPTDNWELDVPTDPRREIVIGSDLMFGNQRVPDDLGMYSEELFYLDTTGNGAWDKVSGGDTFRDFGMNALRATAEPVIGDWDGNGIDDLGLHNEGLFYLDTTGNGAWIRSPAATLTVTMASTPSAAWACRFAAGGPRQPRCWQPVVRKSPMPRCR